MFAIVLFKSYWSYRIIVAIIEYDTRINGFM